MNKLILSIATLILASEAQASVLATKLNNFHIQTQSSLSHLNITEGSVTVDTDSQVVRLALGGDEIIAPLIKTETDGCGSIVYTALDKPAPRTADGITTQIVVKDNTQLICRILLPPTSVELKISGGFIGLRETHEMDGDRLSPRFVKADLQVLDFQAGTFYANEGFEAGRIAVDLLNQSLRLELVKPRTCHGVICLTVMPEKTVITLPLEKVQQYRCNVTDYVSKAVAIEEGGALHKITLRVSEPTRCISTMPVFRATVTLEVQGFVPEAHTFQGSLN